MLLKPKTLTKKAKSIDPYSGVRGILGDADNRQQKNIGSMKYQ